MHNLDSQIAEELIGSVSWGIDIYDAFIVMPNDALLIGEASNSILNKLYNDRKSILDNFKESINIPNTVGVNKEWNRLVKKTKSIKKFKAQASVLK